MKKVFVNFVCKHSQVYVEEIIKNLACFGIDIIAIVSKNMTGIEKWRCNDRIKLYEVDGYTNYYNFLPRLLKFMLIDARQIKKIQKEEKCDLMYIPIVSYWSLFIFRLLKSLPLVYTLHDPIVHNSKKIAIKYTNSYLSKKADRVIILSNSFKEKVKSMTNKSDDMIYVIPSGPENIVVDKSNSKCIITYDERKFNFLFYGQISKHKGLNVLAKAYCQLKSEIDDITLTIAGNGDFSEYYKDFCQLKDCTIINRWIEDNELPSLFNSKRLVTVLPYLTATQSGVVNVAMPYGSPIITTDTGGMKEQIENGVTGILVKPNDSDELYKAMKYAYHNPEVLDSIRKNALKRMDMLSWNCLTNRIVECFNSLDS